MEHLKPICNVQNVCGDPFSLIDFVDTDKVFNTLPIVFDAALSSLDFYLNYINHSNHLNRTEI